MGRIICIVLLCLFCRTGLAQNDSILNSLPKKYQTGVVVYYYDKTDYYFVFKAKDYLQSINHRPHMLRKYPLGVVCDNLINALNKASKQQVTTITDEQLDCMSVDIFLSELFLKNKMKVLCKVGETSYMPVKYRIEKEKALMKVVNDKNPFIIFEGTRSFRRMLRLCHYH